MNPLAWILDSMKVHPEPVSIPDVSDLTPVELAEIRSRLQTFSQVATELRRLVDVELAGKIPVGLRYGNDIYRPTNGRGSAKVVDGESFFKAVYQALESGNSGNPEALLAALFPLHSVKVTGLPSLAGVLGVPADTLRETLVDYEPSTTPLEVKPIQKSAKFLQDLEEGELR